MTQASGSKGQQAGLPGVQAVKEQLQGQRGFSRAAAAGHHHERRPAVFENGQDLCKEWLTECGQSGTGPGFRPDHIRQQPSQSGTGTNRGALQNPEQISGGCRSQGRLQASDQCPAITRKKEGNRSRTGDLKGQFSLLPVHIVEPDRSMQGQGPLLQDLVPAGQLADISGRLQTGMPAGSRRSGSSPGRDLMTD